MTLAPNEIGAIAMAVASLPLLLVGVLVARGNMGLVKGVDLARVRDPHALASQVARWLFAMALALLGGAVALLVAGAGESRLLWVTVAIVVVVDMLAVGMVLSIMRARRSGTAPAPRGTTVQGAPR